MLPKSVAISALREIFKDLSLPWPEKLSVEQTKNPQHGDLATNAAMLAAGKAGLKPRDLAATLAKKLAEACPEIERVEVAGPGFCNITFRPDFWRGVIGETEKKKDAFGHSNAGAGIRAQVEYVSANPTGPLHVGHGRGAALGDSIARLLRAAGYEVDTEYYLNDAGKQMRLLGASIYAKLMNLAGETAPAPEDGYKGEYIADLAAEILAANPGLPDLPEQEGLELCQKYGQEAILDGIKKDLADFRCGHDRYFSERSLVDDGSVDRTLAELKESGHSFEKDGALWFDAKSVGDDKDRVLRKSDGYLTYFATDIAYHRDKFARGNQWLIDVWGADHHGYIPRMKAAISAIGEDPKNLDVVLVQLVALYKDGVPQAMSTRGGNFVTLREVMDETGTDAARFMFLSRSSDSPLDFDLELAKKRTMDNPVYYAQYAHARVRALERRATEQGVVVPEKSSPRTLERLDKPEEMEILKRIAMFEDVLAGAAKALAPHHISRYVLDLAAKIHSYYGKYAIINIEDQELTMARIALLRAAALAIRNGLQTLGVSAPDIM